MKFEIVESGIKPEPQEPVIQTRLIAGELGYPTMQMREPGRGDWRNIACVTSRGVLSRFYFAKAIPGLQTTPDGRIKTADD